MRTNILIALLFLSFNLSAQSPNNGSISGNATYSADVPSVISANTYSLSFNSTTAKVTPASEIIVGDNGAISIWFKKTDITGDGGTIMSSTDGMSYIFVQSPTHLTISLRSPSGAQYSYTCTVPITMASNTWYHLVLNRVAGVTHIYVNNNEGSIAANQVGWFFYISQVGQYAGLSNSFSGKLSDMKVFGNALSANDIAALYAGTATTATPLVYWKMNEGAGATVYDSQGAACTYSISPSSASAPSSAGTGSLAVTGAAGCSWTATSGNTGWLTVTSGSTGSANGTVNYSFTANTSAATRTATITIADKTFTITQAGTSGTVGTNWITSGNNIYYDAGSVGIGTGASHMGDPNYKLFVAKGIRTEKLKVDVPFASWPDYVFDKNYKLPSLEETEKFIKLNKHLPGIPSATEVEKNGIDVGTSQALLLQKIEELTLLLIQQNKRIKALEKQLIK